MMKRHRGNNWFGISKGFLDNPFSFTQEMAPVMGDLYQLSLPLHRIFISSSPAVLKHIIGTNNRNYKKGNIYWKELSRGIGDGLATMEGPSWLARRRLLQPYFQKRSTDQYIPGIGRIVSRILDGKMENGKGDVKIDALELANEITSEIVLNQLFGIESAGSHTQFYRAIREGQEFIFYCSRFPWNKFLTSLNGEKKKFYANVRYFDQFIYSCIGSRRKETAPADNVLTALIRSQPGHPDLSDKQVRDEFITLLGAGSENSSTCFGWALYLLWKHPNVLTKMRKEIDLLLRPGAIPDESIIHKFHYTLNVLKETLRLYPSGYAIIREAQADDRINGELIPRGSTLYFAINVLHRDKSYWKEPDRFWPERFETTEVERALREAYIPFGAGQHLCIGSQLALTELTVMLVLLFSRFDLTLSREDPVAIHSRMTPHPKGGLLFRLKKRQVQAEIDAVVEENDRSRNSS